eukprot:4930596-Pleurochrysis_carterae.AAC.2
MSCSKLAGVLGCGRCASLCTCARRAVEQRGGSRVAVREAPRADEQRARLLEPHERAQLAREQVAHDQIADAGALRLD